MWARLLCVLFFSAPLHCKPIAKQEPTSSTQISVAVRVFKQLMNGTSFSGARRFLTTNLINKKETSLAREVVSTYLNDGNYARFGDFLRSYTHSASAVMLKNNIDQLIARVRVSKDSREAATLLAQVETQVTEVKALYRNRGRALAAAPHGDDSYRFLIDARDDFYEWSTAMRKNLGKSMRPHLRKLDDNGREELVERLLEMRHQLEAFHRSIGLRPIR